MDYQQYPKKQRSHNPSFGTWFFRSVLLIILGGLGKMEADLIDSVQELKRNVAVIISSNSDMERRMSFTEQSVNNMNKNQQKDHTRLMFVWGTLPKKMNYFEDENEEQ